MAPRPASKARYIRPNCSPFMASPTRHTRTSVARSIRNGPRRQRASGTRISAASRNREASSVNGATASTPAGPAM